MVKELKRIRVTPHTTLSQVLNEAAEREVLVEADGRLYQVHRVLEESDKVFADYDPDAALRGIRAAAGSWRDTDPEELKAQIYRAREEGTRPADRS